MKLNVDLVRFRCQEIEDSVTRLELLAQVPREEFLANQDTLDLACYRLLIAIEASLALCYHISAKELRKVPEGYASCFRLLAEAGLIGAELSERLQLMARFRNLLVHMYWKLDYKRVYAILQEGLPDLREFSATVVQLLTTPDA